MVTKLVEATQAGRVVLPADHQLAKAMRPSKQCIEEIERMEQEQALAWQQIRNMLLGSDGDT